MSDGARAFDGAYGQSLPQEPVLGLRYHEGSVAAARQIAREAGVEDRVTRVAKADTYPRGYDLICFSTACDMGRPSMPCGTP